MSAAAMLAMTIDLDIQPGEIPPTVHLKQETDSAAIPLRIPTTDVTIEDTPIGVFKCGIPGDEVVAIKEVSTATQGYLCVTLTASEIGDVTDHFGKFLATISIIDTDQTVTLENYEEFEVVTVQQFFMAIQKSAVS